MVGHWVYCWACKHLYLFDHSWRRNAQRSKPVCAPPPPLPCGAARCFSPAPTDSPPTIARALLCNDQTVRNAIHDFNERGLQALQPRSSRPHTTHALFDARALDRLRILLHQSPRSFGKDTSVWTLELAAEVSFAQGLTPRLVSDETSRAALSTLGVRWKRAKHWITSPDPESLRKKTVATG